MRRTLIILVVTAIAVVLVATATAAQQPIISPKADPYYRYDGLRGTKGFGLVKPREIYYGGDPTGLVCDIHWHSWGGRVARGTGVGWYVSGNQSVGQGHAAIATVTASQLGTWKHRPAYNRLTWSFPKHGRERPASSCI
ncbi:MAG TPA: hypothetical protein VMU39_25200 [Solirubrobacteraceae bacterium]|nr:hypothetical protein [Solirubrobacteraceae bacterium]